MSLRDYSEEEMSANGISRRKPACIPCRTKKQKCPRGEPCEPCAMAGTACYYVEHKKRGMKPGQTESLTRRVEQLEALVLSQTMLLSGDDISVASDEAGRSTLTMGDAIKTVKRKLSKLGDRPEPATATGAVAAGSSPRQTKRPKSTASLDGISVGSSAPGDSLLPPEGLLAELCQVYFEQIHPWIPIMHKQTFLARVAKERTIGICTILQAITAATIKYSKLAIAEQDRYYQRCRQAVVLAAMDRFSVETLQASIIVAFDTIGSGKGPRSWSMVSSISRVVEQLGLAAEEDEIDKQKLMSRAGFLRPSKSVIEREERRRIFWSIFMMDRFCSVTTGWNPSLTSTDVKRRLPIEGTHFQFGWDKPTRFFNIAEYDINPTDNHNALGGYAYLVEATECLSRVAEFLLRETINFSSIQGVRRWFLRFQALDSMVVKWKTFLPERWQYASVSDDGKMDENLTLAHITHNTSVLLLHQNVAFPPADLKVGLPRQSSAQTCLMAAIEVATISSKFLHHMDHRTVSTQYSLCLFLAGRTLLTHSLYYDQPLDTNFEVLVQNLKEFSRRWNANGRQSSENLASKFAARLEQARDRKLPIDSQTAVFASDDDELEQELSMASPPLLDIFPTHSRGTTTPIEGLPTGNTSALAAQSTPLPTQVGGENQLDLGIDFTKEMGEIDHIFMWDETGAPWDSHIATNK